MKRSKMLYDIIENLYRLESSRMASITQTLTFEDIAEVALSTIESEMSIKWDENESLEQWKDNYNKGYVK